MSPDIHLYIETLDPWDGELPMQEYEKLYSELLKCVNSFRPTFTNLKNSLEGFCFNTFPEDINYKVLQHTLVASINTKGNDHNFNDCFVALVIFGVMSQNHLTENGYLVRGIITLHEVRFNGLTVNRVELYDQLHLYPRIGISHELIGRIKRNFNSTAFTSLAPNHTIHAIIEDWSFNYFLNPFALSSDYSKLISQQEKEEERIKRNLLIQKIILIRDKLIDEQKIKYWEPVFWYAQFLSWLDAGLNRQEMPNPFLFSFLKVNT